MTAATQDRIEAAPLAELRLDEVTAQRVTIAKECADTLERMAEAHSFPRLDAATADHLLTQAERSVAFLATLHASSAVAGGARGRLAVKHLAQRLQLAADRLREAREAAGGPVAPVADAPAPEEPLDFATAQPPAESRIPRTVALASVGFSLIVLALGITAQLSTRVELAEWGRQEAPIVEEKPVSLGGTLADIVPVTYAVRDARGNVSAGIGADWIAKSEGERRGDAVAIQAYLKRNGVASIVLYGPDYWPVLTIEPDWMAWEDGAIASR